MKKSTFALILFFWMLSSSLFSYAQTMQQMQLKQIAQVSPNAASLGKYGEYPVGLYTGIPNINIPFYEVNVGRIKLPIGISYNAGGIKVEEIASSVGLGWAFNAGGVITRSVRGMPDEIDPAGETNFFSTLKTVDYMKTLINTDPAGSIAMLKKIAGAKLDAQPDVFYYNFGGVSGKFMYHQIDGKFYSIPYSKLKIEFSNSFGGVTSFTITDEDGIIYSFNEMEISVRETAAVTETSTTSWFLTSIQDPVTFQYVSFTYDQVSLMYQSLGEEAHYYHPYYQEYTANKQSTMHIVTNLKEINFPGGKVKIIRGVSRCDLVGDFAISEIKVFDAANNLIKDYDLNYEYFSGSSSVSCSSNSSRAYAETLRLKLMSVSESSTDGNHNNPKTHSFDYSLSGSYTGLPSRLSFAQDHWGFYNGKDGNPSLFPAYVYGLTPLPGGVRTVNPDYSITGSLNKITYPTKGYTTFELEGNTAAAAQTPPAEQQRSISVPLGTTDYAEEEVLIVANNLNVVQVSVDGFDDSYLPAGYPGHWIRISCENLDGSGPGEVYLIGEGKTGTLDPVNIYLRDGTYKIIIDCVGNPYPDAYQNTVVNFSSTQVLPFNPIENTNLGGLRVKKIKNYDASGNLTTMKYYKYVSENNHLISSGQTMFATRYFSVVNYSPSIPATPPMPSLKRYTRSSYPLVDENGKAMGYSNVIELNGEDDTKGYTQYKFTSFDEAPDVPNTTFSVSTPLSFQWLRGLQTEKKVFKFNGLSSELVSSVENEYDKTLLAVSKKTFQGIRGVFRYFEDNDDIELNWPGEDYFFLGAVVPMHEYYPVFSDFVYIKKTKERTYSGANYVETIKTYSYNAKNLSPSVESSIGSDGQEIAVATKYPLDYNVTSATNPESKGIEKLQEDNNINVPIEQYRYKVLPNTDKLLIGATYYSYREDANLPNSISSYKLPATTTLNYTGIIATPSALSKAPEYKKEIIFDEYDANNNLLQQRKSDGSATSYLYDNNYNYPVAEAVGAVQNDIAFTSFEGGGEGNWSYSGAGNVDASAPTGKLVFRLTNTNTIVKSGLDATKTYALSYWANNTHSPNLSGVVAVITNTVNGWSRYDCLLTGTTQITLSGVCLIDELRLHPQKVLMNTSTYDPLIGMTSHTDAKGMISYYEYDSFKRLKLIKDMQGNIIKTYDYHYKP